MSEAAHRDTSALIIGGTRGPGLAIAQGLMTEGSPWRIAAGRDAARGEAAGEAGGATCLPVGGEEHAAAADFDQHVAGSYPE